MKHSLFALISLFCWLVVGCTPREVRYVIGVSQCSDDEWREQMNKEICREALFYTFGCFIWSRSMAASFIFFL